MFALVRRGTDRRALFVIFYLYFVFGVSFQLYPPLFDSIRSEFGVSHRMVSTLMTLFLAPMVIFAIPGGLVVDRVGVRRVVPMSLVTLTVGLLISAVAPSFSILLLGRALSGVGSAFLVVAVLKIIALNFPRERLGLALGVFAAGLPAATGVAFNLFSLLGWRGATVAGAAVAVSGLIAFRLLARDLRVAPGVQGSRLGFTLAFRNKEVWRVALVAFFGYMAIVSFTTWMPTTLVGYAGIAVWLATLLASILLLIDLPLGPVWGRVSDRVRRRKPFVVAAFVIYLAGSIVVPFVATLPLALAALALLGVITLMGTGCAAFFPAASAIPAQSVRPELAGAAFGLFLTAQFLGMGLGPMVVGYTLDVTSAYVGFVVISLMTGVGLASAMALRTR